MGQLGFFDFNRRYEALNEKNDPLVAIAAMVQKAKSEAVSFGRNGPKQSICFGHNSH